KQELAPIGDVEAHDAFDQRRLAGAVLTEKRMEGTRRDLDRNVLKGLNRSEPAALHLDHLQRRQVVAVIRRAATVFEQQALEAAIVGFAHRRMHADVGGDPGENEIVDAARAQDELEVGGAERALARLIDEGLPRKRLEFVDDIPTRLAADENAPARALVPDAGADALRAP